MVDIKEFNVEDYVKDCKVVKRSVKQYFFSIPGLRQLKSGWSNLKRKIDVYRYGKDSQIQNLSQEKAVVEDNIKRYEKMINKQESKKEDVEIRTEEALNRYDDKLQSEINEKNDPDYIEFLSGKYESEKESIRESADEKKASIDRVINDLTISQANEIERYRYLSDVESAVAEKRGTKTVTVGNNDDKANDFDYKFSFENSNVKTNDKENQDIQFTFASTNSEQEKEQQEKEEIPESIREIEENHKQRIEDLIGELVRVSLDGNKILNDAWLNYIKTTGENLEAAHKTEIERIENKYRRENDELKRQLFEERSQKMDFENKLKNSDNELKNERDKSKKQANKINELENQVQDLNDKNNELTKSNKEKDKQYKELEEKYNGLSGEVAHLKEQFAGMIGIFNAGNLGGVTMNNATQNDPSNSVSIDGGSAYQKK